MLLDWDKLSETELKRLVSQLEKTRNDLRYIRTSIFRDFFHFRRLCKNIILIRVKTEPSITINSQHKSKLSKKRKFIFYNCTYIFPFVTKLFVYCLLTIVNYLVKSRIK